jgi:hypothetical protein
MIFSLSNLTNKKYAKPLPKNAHLIDEHNVGKIISSSCTEDNRTVSLCLGESGNGLGRSGNLFRRFVLATTMRLSVVS